MRTFMLAVTGLVIAVAACSSYGTSVVEVGKTRAQVASVSLTIPSSLAAGQTARAIATPKDANGTALTDRPIAWYSSSAAIASVNDSGVISAVAPGNTVVSAVSEGIAGQASMAITPPPPTPIATVSVAVSPPAVLIGQTAQATATLQDSSGNLISGRTVTWESSDISIATVDTTGTVKATGLGNAMIKASSGGKNNSSRLSVSAPAPIPVASVSVSPASASLQIGATVQLSATTRDANGAVLTGRVIGWNSGNTSIATVSSTGLVTAIAGGSVSITAGSEGQTASAAITVSPPAPAPVATVSVSPASSSVLTGATVQLSATTRDASNNVLTGRVVTWSSGNTSIATVNSGTGLVTAVAAGSVTITATSETKMGTAAITVSAPAPVPVATVTVSPASSSVQVGGTLQLSATTRDASGNVLSGRVVRWSSANTSIARIDSISGFFTAVAVGPVTITATSETKTGTAAITVIVPPPPGLWRGNEPAGMTLVSDQSFATMPSDGWNYYFGAGTISDPSAPRSPNSVMNVTWPAGAHGGNGIGRVEKQLTVPYGTLYMSVWIKFTNWQGGDGSVNKLGSPQGPAGNRIVLEAGGIGSGPLTPRINLQGIIKGGNTGGGTSGSYDSNLLYRTFTRGQWDLLEMVAVANTTGNADGSVDLYLNGEHVAQCTGVQFESSGFTFQWFVLEPLWSNPNDVVTSTMAFAADQIYLSGKK